MARRISDLTTAAAATSGDYIPIVQGGITKKVDVANLRTSGASGKTTKAMVDANQTLSTEEAEKGSWKATGALTAKRKLTVTAPATADDGYRREVKNDCTGQAISVSIGDGYPSVRIDEGTSAVVDVTPSGVFLVARSSQHFDARDFGAIGDGTSHPLSEWFASLAAAQAVYPAASALSDEIDWAAAQKAITAARNTEPASSPNIRGGTVKFGKGVFVFNRKLDFSNSRGVSVIGEGAATGANLEGGTMLLFTGSYADTSVEGATNASPIAITSTAHGYSTGDIVVISGVVGNTAANGRFMITVTGADTYTLNGSTGNGAYVSGGTVVHHGSFIDARSTFGFTLDGCSISYDDAAYGGHLIDLSQSSALVDTQLAQIRNCTLSSSGIAAGEGARALISLEGAILCAIENCYFGGAISAIRMREEAGATVAYSNAHLIKGCTFIYHKYPLVNAGQGVAIVGCWFEGSGGEMLCGYIDDLTQSAIVESLSFHGCWFGDQYVSASHWLQFGQRVDGLSVTGCLFVNSGTNDHAIVIGAAGANGVFVAGNKFQTDLEPIDLGSTVCNGVAVLGNCVLGCTTTAITTSAAAHTNRVVAGNTSLDGGSTTAVDQVALDSLTLKGILSSVVTTGATLGTYTTYAWAIEQGGSNMGIGANATGGLIQTFSVPLRINALGQNVEMCEDAGRVGIGRAPTTSKLEVNGDVEVYGGSANGVILKSPDNTRWRIAVDNSGNLSASAA